MILSVLEFDVLWEHLQLGPMPPVLEIQPYGATLDERARLADCVWDSLAERELGWPGQLDWRIETRLRRLAAPEWELDARLQLAPTGPGTVALITTNTANSTSATLAIRHGEHVTLHSIPSDTMVAEAVALLPKHPPGGSASITFTAHALDVAAARAGTNPSVFARTLEREGLSPGEARKIADVATNVIRFGHFGVARTRRFDKRQRAGHVVSVYDTHQHRYLFTRKPSGGLAWVTLVPGTKAAITRQIDELLTELNTPVSTPR